MNGTFCSDVTSPKDEGTQTRSMDKHSFVCMFPSLGLFMRYLPHPNGPNRGSRNSNALNVPKFGAYRHARASSGCASILLIISELQFR